MAFQVPKVDRFAPQDTPSVGRVDVQAPNLANANAAQADAAGNLVESASNNYVKYVQEAADTEGLKASNEMDRYLTESLDGENGIKRQKGNPYELYQKLEGDEEKKFGEIRDRYKDASTEAKAAVEKKLLETRAKFYDRKITARGVQVNEYEDNITDDSVKIKKNDMMDSVAHLDINDPHSTTKLNAVINDIYNLRVTRGLKNGSVKEIYDDKGQLKGYDMQPGVKFKIAEDTSEGLYQTIENLSKAGDVEGAKFISEKYGVFLDAHHKVKVTETLAKDVTEVEAYNNAVKFSKLSPDAQESAISKIDNVKIQEKTRLKLDTIQRQRQNTEDRNDKKNYSDAGTIVLDRMKSGNPFLTADQMLNDPQIKRMVEHMNPKQRMALEHMVDQPKDSDPKVLATAQRTLFDGGFRGMDPLDFQQATAGLSKGDKSKMQNIYTRINESTDGEMNQSMKRMSSDLTRHLQVMGYVRKNDFGKYNVEDENKITVARDRLLEEVAKAPKKVMSLQEENDYVKNLAVSIAKDTAFKSGSSAPTPKFSGTVNMSGKPKQSDAPAVDATTAPPVTGSAQRTRKDAMKALATKDAKGNFIWPTEDQIQNYIKGK